MFYVPSPIKVSNDVEVSHKKKVQKHTASSYKYEIGWRILINEKNFQTIQNVASRGDLKSSGIRCIYWQVLLGILPLSTDWLTIVRELRYQYNNIKDGLTLDPHQTSCVPDDNPLSQNKNSMWYRYFCDKELRRIIELDVTRILDSSFYQLPHIQKIMIDILFCYARQHPDLCYRQGMHEILAVILRVFYEEYQELEQEKQISVINSSITELMNMEYLESDVYFLFSFVMNRARKFYSLNRALCEADGHIRSLDESSHTSIVEDEANDSEICQHLNYIRDTMLSKYDYQLYIHLKKLNIPFTAFGIRYFRLLYGREFPFDDLLLLWDAIFAANSDFVLVQYIIISMLIVIREKLLHSDFVQCLQYLMMYPKKIDVRQVINYAKHLEDPKTYKKPKLQKLKYNDNEYNNTNISVQNNNDKMHSVKQNNLKSSVKSASLTKRLKNLKSSSNRKGLHNDNFSSKTIDTVAAELKHVQDVMTLCKLKLCQYHDILVNSVSADNVKAQHALVGIQELCTLLDIDQFTFKSSQSSSLEIETAYEADEIQQNPNDEFEISLLQKNSNIFEYLPPPKTDIDMKIFNQIECTTTDVSKFPLENPLKLCYDNGR